MKNVILNMMILGIVGGLVGGEASAISFFGKSKSKTSKVQDEDASTVKSTASKTKSSSKSKTSKVQDEDASTVESTASKKKSSSFNVASKIKESLSSAKNSIKTAYQKKKSQSREKAHQKELAEEGKPINAMFKSKSEVEYNLKDLKDVYGDLKNIASSAEKSASSTDNAFAVKSLLFEISVYAKLCAKFSEQYLEGMNKLKKSKQYDDENYNLAMNEFEMASETIRYESVQRNLIKHAQGLVKEGNLRSMSEKDALSVLKTLENMSAKFEKISESAAKLEDVISIIDDQTLDEKGDFKILETNMLNHVKRAKDVLSSVSNILKKAAKTVENCKRAE